MAEVKWIKIVTDIFDDEKILFIEQLPEADSIIVIWFKLLTLAGKINNGGVLLFNDKLPYTDEMLATIFRRPINTVRLAIKTFIEFEMVEVIKDTLVIPNWSKHQSLDQLESKKEYMRNYMREYREKQKELVEGKTNSKTNSKANVSLAEIDIEEDIDIDIDIDKDIDKEQLPSNYKKTIIEKWNSLGLQQLRNIANNRLSLLNARIKEYSFDEVIQAIDSVNSSSFLKGQNKQGWTITFDWMIKPNNFVKVIEGNYLDKEANRGEYNRDNGGETKGSEDEIDWAEMAGVKSF